MSESVFPMWFAVIYFLLSLGLLVFALVMLVQSNKDHKESNKMIDDWERSLGIKKKPKWWHQFVRKGRGDDEV